MALSRRDVIVAGAVFVVAWSFTVQRFPVLRYTAHAFIAGSITVIVACVVVTLSSRSTRGISDRTHIKLLEPQVWAAEVAAWREGNELKKEALYPSSFVISDKLNDILDLLLRDYITSWYNGISKSPRFRNNINVAIRTALARIVDRVVELDIVEVAVSRLVPVLTDHLRNFCEAERLVRGKNLNREVTESEELDRAIAAKYCDGNLHPAASLSFSDMKLAQQDYLRKIAVRLLPQLLPDQLIKSRAVFILIKEIAACSVLWPLMRMLSDPDYWNQTMEAYGRVALQDRKTVRKLRAALDQHAVPSPSSKSRVAFPRLCLRDSERDFERFIRAIRQLNNISDVRRMRSEIASQLKRESLVEGQDQIYIRRLEAGKRILDQKVAKLSTRGRSSARSSSEYRNRSESVRPTHDSLVDIMRNASGLSYFMEYMDRQHLMSLVQFWIVVDGFRNPLESNFADEADNLGDLPAWTDTDRIDIAQINEAYLLKPELQVPEESKAAVQVFLRAGRKATTSQYRTARTAILKAQTVVLEELTTKYFPLFKRSDLFYKYLTTDEANLSLETSPKKSEFQSRMPARSPDGRLHAQSRKPTRMISFPRPSQRLSLLRKGPRSLMDVKSEEIYRDERDEPRRARRSLDSHASSFPFDDECNSDFLANSTASLPAISRNRELNEHAQIEVVEAMEAALSDIIASPLDQEDDVKSSLFESREGSVNSFMVDSTKSSLDLFRNDMSTTDKDKEKPSLASLGLVNPASRIGVFTDDDLFSDEDKFIEDEQPDPQEPEDEKRIEDEIHEAAPGDLGLVEAIAVLNNDIERLTAQEEVVDTLTKKAELTNNAAELRILGKSKASLRREIRRKELQRQQYIIQESDNSLYGRSTILIKSIMVGKEDDGKEFALYLIEVQRQAGEQMPAASWAIARRYSEFHELHQRLRALYPSVRSLDFPRRRMVLKLQKEFLHKRRKALEHYLQQLLLLPDICRSRDLRAFLSQQAIISSSEEGNRPKGSAHDIITRLYNSVTDGMDEFLGNIPVLDQLSIAGQNLISAATSHLSTLPANLTEDPIGTAEAEAELAAFENAQQNRDLEPFVKPICDIFLEVFELNRGNNWLRGRAVVVVLHQLLGGTIERKVRDNSKEFATEQNIMKYLDKFKMSFWPDGKLRPAIVRTKQEKARSRTEASLMLATLVPELAANVVGRANAQAASRRIFAMLNNERLNVHLTFTLLDEVVKLLFD